MLEDEVAVRTLNRHPDLDVVQVVGAVATIRFELHSRKRYPAAHRGMPAPTLDPDTVRAKVRELFKWEAIGG